MKTKLFAVTCLLASGFLANSAQAADATVHLDGGQGGHGFFHCDINQEASDHSPVTIYTKGAKVLGTPTSSCDTRSGTLSGLKVADLRNYYFSWAGTPGTSRYVRIHVEGDDVSMLTCSQGEAAGKKLADGGPLCVVPANK